jgi:hypothetical protein
MPATVGDETSGLTSVLLARSLANSIADHPTSVTLRPGFWISVQRWTWVFTDEGIRAEPRRSIGVPIRPQSPTGSPSQRPGPSRSGVLTLTRRVCRPVISHNSLRPVPVHTRTAKRNYPKNGRVFIFSDGMGRVRRSFRIGEIRSPQPVLVVFPRSPESPFVKARRTYQSYRSGQWFSFENSWRLKSIA